MPLTDKGFQRPTFEDLLDAQIARAKELFGEDIDTSETSVLGKYIRLNVTDLTEMYETLEGVYYARFPNTARGLSLDRLCAFVGIKRNPATYARYKIVVQFNIGDDKLATIPYGFQFSNEDKTVTYHTIDDYEWHKAKDTGGMEVAEYEMYVDCDELGTVGNISPEDINTVVNPIPLFTNKGGKGSSIAARWGCHYAKVTAVSEGIETESDVSLRRRFTEAISGAGSSTVEALKGCILRVSGVEGVSIVENSTNATVSGMPAHSFQCYVLYSDESQATEISKAIYENKPIGIQAYGTKSYTVIDDAGISHTVAFSKTLRKEIYLKATIQTNSNFNSDVVEDMKENIVEQINKSKNGDEVYISSFYGYLHVDGVETVTSLTLSTDGKTYTASNITCADNEVARAVIKNISIEVI